MQCFSVKNDYVYLWCIKKCVGFGDRVLLGLIRLQLLCAWYFLIVYILLSTEEREISVYPACLKSVSRQLYVSRAFLCV